jgi:pimeloyl-ACP methyl ester carboxylesterase
VREEDGGWAWKFDAGIFAHEPLRPDDVSQLDCPVAVVRPERGLVDAEMGAMLSERLGEAAHLIEVPAAGHHIMLDQPIALVTGLRALLAVVGSTE